MSEIDPTTPLTARDGRTLTIDGFNFHLGEIGVDLIYRGRLAGTPVVIRGAKGDYGLAAVHTDGVQIILDLGKPLDGQPETA